MSDRDPHLPAAAPGDATPPAAIPIPSLWEQARASWPGVHITLDDFTVFLTDRSAAGLSLSQLGAERAAELYLVCGCAAQLPAALAAFTTRYLSRVPVFLHRMSLGEAAVADIKQILSEKLFVSTPESPAKITDYSGQGALVGWLRVVAVRTALAVMRKRSEQPLAEPDREDRLMAVEEDADLTYLKNRYQSEFKEAFAAALAQLTSEQRNLLRLHLIDGLSIDKLGAAFKIHRATAARWLQTAREGVLIETRRLLQERLRLAPSEVDSLVRVLRSQLDLSVSRLLKDEPKA